MLRPITLGSIQHTGALTLCGLGAKGMGQQKMSVLEQVPEMFHHTLSVYTEHTQPGQLRDHCQKDVLQFLQPRESWWGQICACQLTEAREGTGKTPTGWSACRAR